VLSSAVKLETAHFSKNWLLRTSPHSDLTQKNIITIITTLKILNLTKLVMCFFPLCVPCLCAPIFMPLSDIQSTHAVGLHVTSEISGSHIDKYGDGCLLDCCAM
jgi:hypothetical protein